MVCPRMEPTRDCSMGDRWEIDGAWDGLVLYEKRVGKVGIHGGPLEIDSLICFTWTKWAISLT
jgi:hypothetical protein